MTKLHILNGDAMLNAFDQTGLDGEVMVWREVLSEGPLAPTIDASFWETRQQWITGTFEDAPGSYQDMVLSELEKLSQPYDEITLWFDNDLHCQVNLLGVLQLLKDQVDLSAPGIYLVSPGAEQDSTGLRGMAQLNGDELEDLYDARLHLTEYDLTLSTEAWQKYTANDPDALQQWISTNPFWGSLHKLKPALEAQVQRSRVGDDGLNNIERTLVRLNTSGIDQRAELYEAFWNEQPVYGMGGAELDLYLDRLASRGLIQLQA